MGLTSAFHVGQTFCLHLTLTRLIKLKSPASFAQCNLFQFIGFKSSFVYFLIYFYSTL